MREQYGFHAGFAAAEQANDRFVAVAVAAQGDEVAGKYEGGVMGLVALVEQELVAGEAALLAVGDDVAA